MRYLSVVAMRRGHDGGWHMTTLAVGDGAYVQIHHRGRIVAACVRHGRGWSAYVDGRQVEAVTLDALLTALGVLPDHHRVRH